jgi:hypothetical protein
VSTAWTQFVNYWAYSCSQLSCAYAYLPKQQCLPQFRPTTLTYLRPWDSLPPSTTMYLNITDSRGRLYIEFSCWNKRTTVATNQFTLNRYLSDGMPLTKCYTLRTLTNSSNSFALIFIGISSFYSVILLQSDVHTAK